MRGFVLLLAASAMVFAAPSAAGYPLTGPTGGSQPHTNMQPSLGINHIIALQGLYPSRDSAPGDGSAVPPGVDPFLGEVILLAGNFAPRGWAFCDGQLLPIAQNTALFSLLGTTYGGDGRTTFGLPDLRGRTALHKGAGPGLTNRYLGSKTGVEDVTLTVGQLPPHSHTLPWVGDTTYSTGGGQAHTNMQPSLTLNRIIALTGVFPSRDSAPGDGSAAPPGAEPFIAEVSMFAGNFAPRGWASCDGQLLSIAQNTALFALVGTTYGGDGRTTFGLPDARGRAVMHEGAGPGLTNHYLGSKVGVEDVTLTVGQMPQHDHTLPPTTFRTGDTGGSQAHPNVQPSLTLNYIIALWGTYPSRSPGDPPADDEPIIIEPSGGEPFIGEINLFAGNFAPRGWAFCDGQLLSIAEHMSLFSLLGTMYGGDGRTTFALPDLRGRVPIHPGTGPGLTRRRPGERIGVENVTLTVGQMPSHDHAVPEPATLLLLCGAGAPILLKRRRS